MSGIKFGTDGWRAIIAREFTFANVALVAQAIAQYLHEHRLAAKGIVVGYDNRFLSDKFAETVAEVMAGNQIPVWLTVKATPTPVTAYTIKWKDAAGAVMLTASHNPPEYNGIKFIPDYAGPALPHITDEIEHFLQQLTGDGQVKQLPLEKAKEAGLIQDVEPFQVYLDHLASLIHVADIRRHPLKVVVDPLYGAGIGYLEHFLREAGCQVEVMHNYRDCLFGGSVPEPTGKILGELRDKVQREGADLGIALDGDADRFGIIDRNGDYISPNQVIYLALYHLLETRGKLGPAVARTVATTHMVDRIAARYGLTVEETPVGFKYIGQSLLERGSLLGGEESGGISIHGHVPEKDGILAASLVVEMVARWGMSLTELMEELSHEYGRLVSERLDIHCRPADKARVLQALHEFALAEVAGLKVRQKVTVDGTKVLLEGDNWFLVRPSGTEPLFRIYVEAINEEKLRQIQQEVREYLGL